MLNLKFLVKSFSFNMLLVLFFSCQTEEEKKQASSDPFWNSQTQELLLDFEEEQIDSTLISLNSKIKLINTAGVTSGNQALQINLPSDQIHTGFTYKPKEPIDASKFNNFSIVFDVTNLTQDHSVQLYLSVSNEKGEGITRSAAIPQNDTKTLFFELSGELVSKEIGLRDNPHPFADLGNESIHMKIQGLKKEIDFSTIAWMRFQAQHIVDARSIVIDNIRLVETPVQNPDFLTGIIDKYGQNAKVDFEGKITSDQQLKDLADQELKQLKEEGDMPGRSQYGGWLEGPKYEATGYFRTQKIGEKWALIDPEGYIFFSHGLANARMANMTTFTGMDFRNDTIRYRDPEDVTPEDSRGIVALSKEVTNTAYEAYPWRKKMFQGLPSYDDPLANNYSYRRSQYIGPFEHGETFSHYQANLERRYGEPTPDYHRNKWVDVTLDRFKNWGFTSFGNWAAYEFYHENRMPYFANGWVIGDFKTVKSGLDYWGPMPDVFDPEFTRRTKVTIDVIAKEVKNNPWCIGVFVDNEKSWGRSGSIVGRYGIVFNAFILNADSHPIKKTYVTVLKEKYSSIQKLNQAWNTTIGSWEVFESGLDLKGLDNFTDAFVSDCSQLLEMYARKYFSTVHNELEKQLPNHLYLGCRFATWGMSEEVRKAASDYVDVFSYNYYHEALSKKYWKFLEEIDKPSLIGEFHIGTVASGLYHPGLIQASSREDRARMYKRYMETVIDNPYFVGAHWFQYLDSPTSGRAHDGENYNVGFVNIADIPYPEMVKTAKEINSALYETRYGFIKNQKEQITAIK